MYSRQDYVHCSGASGGHRKCAKAAEAYANIIGMVKSELCLPSNGVSCAQNGERANFTSFLGAPHATIMLYASASESQTHRPLATVVQV
jgi:hypothetical protein